MRPYLPFAATFAAFIAPLILETVRAQGLYGSLVGNVTDATTASVPGAKVRITQVQTNRVRETQTNTDGSYTFPAIPPGTYEIEISQERFQSFTQRNIPVTINTTVRIDASLVVGAAAQSVEVTGQTALLQTETAEVHSEFTTNSLSNLPLPPGRNYELLYTTIPGFTPPANWGPLPTNPSRITTSTVNGASHNAVSLTIDGANARSVWMRGGAMFAPALEAIETVNVVTAISASSSESNCSSASILSIRPIRLIVATRPPTSQTCCSTATAPSGVWEDIPRSPARKASAGTAWTSECCNSACTSIFGNSIIPDGHWRRPDGRLIL